MGKEQLFDLVPQVEKTVAIFVFLSTFFGFVGPIVFIVLGVRHHLKSMTIIGSVLLTAIILSVIIAPVGFITIIIAELISIFFGLITLIKAYQ